MWRDLVVSYREKAATWRRGPVDRTRLATHIIIGCPPARSRSVSVGDLNGDGYPDVVVAFEYTNTVTWYQNYDGAGRFPLQGVDIATDTVGASWVTVGDIDGDGDLDVISTSIGDGGWRELNRERGRRIRESGSRMLCCSAITMCLPGVHLRP